MKLRQHPHPPKTTRAVEITKRLEDNKMAGRAGSKLADRKTRYIGR